MQLIENQPLKDFNTFGLDASAAHFFEAKTEADVRSVLKKTPRPILVLGGGSNILLTQKTVGGLVLKNSILGKSVEKRFKNTVWARVGGGENWHETVMWSLENGLAGLENLSLIPGTVGAAPIQNIGAYGVELKDVFLKLEAIDLETGRKRSFSAKECHFGYRDSFFKKELRGRFLISAVWFRLFLKPKINVSYGAIADVLNEKGIASPTARDVSEAVISIRRSKLPDPAVIGNSGSFFKNPTIERAFFEKISTKWPKMPAWPQENGSVKIPAGWLIEQCGWKGQRLGNAGCYEKQALVLVNLGGATGAEVWALAEKIIASVAEKFGIRLEAEVNVI